MKKLCLPLAIILCLVFFCPAMAFEIRPKGRLHLDYALHNQGAQALDDRFLVRRARLGVEGKVKKDWSFEVAYELTKLMQITDKETYGHGDFKDGFKDLWVRYNGWKPLRITVGQFTPPFTLEKTTSSNNLAFIERSLPNNAFGLSERLGVGVDLRGQSSTLAMMIFDGSMDGKDRGYGAAARITYAPINSQEKVVHLGVSAMTEYPQKKIKVQARPESKASDIRFLNTGNLDNIHGLHGFGLEGAWQMGSFLTQAEWLQTIVHRQSGQPNVHFHGWTMSASWLLTGQAHKYRNGGFKGIDIKGPAGALELTTRYSYLDLDDYPVRGGREHNWTLGLNYYVNQYLRFMANYINVHSKRRQVRNNPDIFLFRVQLQF